MTRALYYFTSLLNVCLLKYLLERLWQGCEWMTSAADALEGTSNAVSWGEKINNAAENNRKKSEVWEKWPGDVHINYSGGGGEGSNMQLLEGWKHFSLNCAEQMCLHIYIWLKKKTQSLQTTSILVAQMLRVVINSYSSGFSSLSFCSASLDQVQASLSEGMSQNRLCSGSLSSFWLLILLLLLAFV